MIGNGEIGIADQAIQEIELFDELGEFLRGHPNPALPGKLLDDFRVGALAVEEIGDGVAIFGEAQDPVGARIANLKEAFPGQGNRLGNQIGPKGWSV